MAAAVVSPRIDLFVQQDGARAQKADAADDLRGDARGIDPRVERAAEGGESIGGDHA